MQSKLTNRWECNGGPSQRWSRGIGAQIKLTANQDWCLGDDRITQEGDHPEAGQVTGNLVLVPCDGADSVMFSQDRGMLCRTSRGSVGAPGEFAVQLAKTKLSGDK